MKKISILIPCYNEEEVLPLFIESIELLLQQNKSYDWELLFVNDGSSDLTLSFIKDYKMRNDRVKYVDFSRNFGKEIAMMAGLDFVTGDCVVIMDADLQHPPEAVPGLIKCWEEGYENVVARRVNDKDGFFIKNYLSALYYKLIRTTTRLKIYHYSSDFRLLDRVCIDALKECREVNRFTKGLFSWIGFSNKEILYIQRDRELGNGKWQFRQLFKLAIDGITSFTFAPLRLAYWGSFLSFLFFVFYSLFLLVNDNAFDDHSFLMLIILFLGSVQLLSIGILGEYLGRNFIERKKRPPYIIREKG